MTAVARGTSLLQKNPKTRTSCATVTWRKFKVQLRENGWCVIGEENILALWRPPSRTDPTCSLMKIHLWRKKLKEWKEKENAGRDAEQNSWLYSRDGEERPRLACIRYMQHIQAKCAMGALPSNCTNRIRLIENTHLIHRHVGCSLIISLKVIV